MTKIITLMVTFVNGSTMQNDLLEERGEIFYRNFYLIFETLIQLLGLGDLGLLAQRHVDLDHSYVTESACQNHVPAKI